MGKDGEIAVMVEEEVELDRPLRLTEGGPIKQGGAEVDDRGIETEELILETELLLARGDGPALLKKLVQHLLVELPGTLLIRVGQRGPERGQRRCRDASASPNSLRDRRKSPGENGPDLTDTRAWQRTVPTR